MRRCSLVRLLSARCCCVTAVELALPGQALLALLLPGLALPGLALLGQALLGLGLALLGQAPESQPERAASAIPRGLQPKDAPS